MPHDRDALGQASSIPGDHLDLPGLLLLGQGLYSGQPEEVGSIGRGTARLQRGSEYLPASGLWPSRG